MGQPLDYDILHGWDPARDRYFCECKTHRRPRAKPLPCCTRTAAIERDPEVRAAESLYAERQAPKPVKPPSAPRLPREVRRFEYRPFPPSGEVVEYYPTYSRRDRTPEEMAQVQASWKKACAKWERDKRAWLKTPAGVAYLKRVAEYKRLTATLGKRQRAYVKDWAAHQKRMGRAVVWITSKGPVYYDGTPAGYHAALAKGCKAKKGRKAA